MTPRSFILASVSALLALAVGCDAPREAAPESGTLDVTIAASDLSLGSASDGAITITGLDAPLSTNVSLSSDTPRGSLALSLPPGLYGVQWKPDPMNTRGADLPRAESAMRMVVVAAGGTSSVVVRAVRDTSAQQFASAESVASRLASL